MMPPSTYIEEPDNVIDFKNLREDPSYHIGAIDETATSLTGGWFSGWALQKSNSRPPAGFLVASDTGMLRLFPNHRRNDLARKFGADALLCGVVADLPLSLIAEVFAPSLKYYAYDGIDVITRLHVVAGADVLSSVQLVTLHDFFRLVQTPSTRLTDTRALVHLALHTLTRGRDNYVVAAAAACVLGYRVLEGADEIKERSLLVKSEIARLLGQTPQIERGLFVRWHTSLRLIAGYLAYQDHLDSESISHFKEISKFTSDLDKWPQALTNMLIGTAISGYLLYQKGSVVEAIETWNTAEDMLRYGAGIAQFQNFYAYGELGNAVKVAQFAHVAALCAVRGGSLDEVSLAPLGTTIDVRKIPGPISKLVLERNK